MGSPTIRLPTSHQSFEGTLLEGSIKYINQRAIKTLLWEF